MELKAWDHVGRLFAYPDENYLERVLETEKLLGESCREASDAFSLFARWVEASSLGQLQEHHTEAFDMNTEGCLEVGHHLFGEGGGRGLFLADVRERLRAAGLEESFELPDHLSHVLPLLSRLPPDEARTLVQNAVRPALQRMASGHPSDGPVASLLAAVSALIYRSFPTQTESAAPHAQGVTPHA